MLLSERLGYEPSPEVVENSPVLRDLDWVKGISLLEMEIIQAAFVRSNPNGVSHLASAYIHPNTYIPPTSYVGPHSLYPASYVGPHSLYPASYVGPHSLYPTSYVGPHSLYPTLCRFPFPISCLLCRFPFSISYPM